VKSHLLHISVANEIEPVVRGLGQFLKDKACGGNLQIPLFLEKDRSRQTQICKVDLLVLGSDGAKVIVEIEESGFSPTKICGKFLTSALAKHFIHDSIPEPVELGDRVMFVQVLDQSKFPKIGTQKIEQSKRIEGIIQNIVLHGWSSIKKYNLFLVDGHKDTVKLKAVAEAVSQFLA